MKKINILLTTAALTLTLAGCDGDGGGNGDGDGGGGNTPDTFVGAVQDLVATSPDNTDPQPLTDFPAPDAPDNTDPSPL